MSKISHRRAFLLAAVVPALLVAGCAAGTDSQAMKGEASPASPTGMMSPGETGTGMESESPTSTETGSPTGTAGAAQARSAVMNFFDALKSGNVDKVVSSFSDDAVVAIAGKATATGGSAIRSLYQEQLKNKDVSKATHTIEDSRDLGQQYAVVRARSKQGGDAYRELFLLADQGGQWKITDLMTNKPG
ncbi:nuclear transport factor 2 family protein [Nonomuraea sp. LP-02]|uniref:YybH family protein n=1 Tax=Nonomuraea sp. LP-02 TaxID=3097960 RepID=UPI002E30E250|nr:nuclear transport factor 2 family protein [Nonomuraea sp. LP-02]MED7922657.1 nuclear transport factor 2 family protein [Nonomuraea sp. LP-02]